MKFLFATRHKSFCFLFIICFLVGFFSFARIVSAADKSAVFITAVQISGVAPNDDFIELYNDTCFDVDLSNWKIFKKTRTGTTPSSIGTLKKIIPAKSYFLWENTSENLNDTPDYATRTYYLSTDYSIAIFDASEKQIDSLTWGANQGPFENTLAYPANPGKSETLLRSLGDTFSIEKNYFPKNSSFTKTDELLLCSDEIPPADGKEESEDEASEKEPDDLTNTDQLMLVFLNEILPNPSSDKEEFIELYNPHEKTIDLTGWILRDASKTGKYVFPTKTLIASLDFLVVYKTAFKFALNNSGLEKISLFDPKEKLISSVSYTGSKKNLSYNFNDASWRWSKFLTPGLENTFNNLPQSKNKIPKKAFQDTYVDFSTKAKDPDNDKLKYTWDFGDGHKSYLKKTRHKFEKTGKFIVTLKTNDGSEDKVETFPIEIKKFPKFDIEIVSLSPNPKGKDTGTEYITLKNNEKKKVDLKDWSIATGWKNIINHPIAESLVIQPKSELKLTNLNSKFTLQNKFSKVELRYPSGKVASKMKYKKDDGVYEGEIYQKEKNGWTWKTTLPTEASDTEKMALVKNVSDAPQSSVDLMQIKLQDEEQKKQELIQDLESNLGNFSPQEKNDLPTRQIEAQMLPNPILILSANPTKNIPSNDNVFFFTPYQPEQPHYLISFVNDLFFSINSNINSFLSS